MSSLMTNSFTVVAKVFSNTLIFLLQNCESYSHFISAKISMYLPYFNATLAYNFVKF